MSQIGKFMILYITLLIVLEFVGIPTPVSVSLSNFGVDINSNTGQLISADIESSSIFSQIFGASGILLTIGAAGAVIIGLFARSYDTSLIILPFLIFIGTSMIGTTWGIISYVGTYNAQWLTNIIAVIFIGLGVGFVMACVDYFRTGQ